MRSIRITTILTLSIILAGFVTINNSNLPNHLCCFQASIAYAAGGKGKQPVFRKKKSKAVKSKTLKQKSKYAPLRPKPRIGLSGQAKLKPGFKEAAKPQSLKKHQVLAKGKNAYKYVPSRYVAIVQNAFIGEVKALKLRSDMIVHRRHSKREGYEIRSPWYSRQEYKTLTKARKHLATPISNPANKVSTYLIPSGSIILVGKVAPQIGKKGYSSNATGGGEQIYVTNPQLVRRLN